ncbi:MAG TPA: hypothetical protein VKS44_17095 [Candidatus Acidoferrales bacterium]|nr:hypothetical protein [Candidatus Acidoferrales bacterium]
MRHTVLTLPVNSQEKNAISAEEEWIGLPGLKPNPFFDGFSLG